jgi:hypothetical protein
VTSKTKSFELCFFSSENGHLELGTSQEYMYKMGYVYRMGRQEMKAKFLVGKPVVNFHLED